MRHDIDIGTLTLRDHRFGRINRRMPIGPVRWPFHDLLWIHEGRVEIVLGEPEERFELVAPGGILIQPGTLFSGRTIGAFATASICHFVCAGTTDAAFLEPGVMLPRAGEALHIQNQLLLAMHLARNSTDDLDRRRRLLVAVLDGFTDAATPGAIGADEDRVALAWTLAAQHLDRIRTLSDVAGLLDISESAFRALHRRAWQTSAGEHLRQLRLTKAEELLATTSAPLSEIAARVGYGHAATLSAAFRKRRGRTPGEYRHWSNPFT